MAKIQVYIHGQLLSELLLEPGQEYFAGRGNQCQIVLANERGISRQHLKIFRQVDCWVVQLVAKYGGIIYDGQQVEIVHLNANLQFSIPPYEFHFVDTPIQKPELFDNTNALNLEASLLSNKTTAPAAQTKATQTKTEKEQTFSGNLDATVVASSQLIAYIRIYNNKTKTEEVLKLEGNVWVAGRHPSCDIVINDSAFSRKHFEITKTSEGYFITDNESSNGTFINGEKIATKTATKILSGDVITIKHIEFIFELHDGDYKNKINYLVPFEDEVESEEFMNSSEPTSQEQTLDQELTVIAGPSAMANETRLDKAKKLLLKAQPFKFQITLGCLFCIVIYGVFFQSQSGKVDNPSQTPSTELSPDKRKEVQDIFNLAQNYYIQRKFVMCVSQTEKLHGIVPFFSNSKELDTLCRQAQELEQIEQDRLRKEEERTEVENRIRNKVESCKQSMTDKTTRVEITACLQEAIDLDPQNGAIIDLQNQLAIKEAAQQDQMAKKQSFIVRQQTGRELFNTALAHYKNGQLKLALKEFRQFINGRFPGLNQNEDAAIRNISSIEQTLEQKLSAQVLTCQAALDKSELKQAIKSCDQVLSEEPKNARAREARSKAYSQLKREMKALYDDASLEESLGNIDAAKEKWSKIMDRSLASEDYYQKARKKLGKYGIGN